MFGLFRRKPVAESVKRETPLPPGHKPSPPRPPRRLSGKEIWRLVYDAREVGLSHQVRGCHHWATDFEGYRFESCCYEGGAYYGIVYLVRGEKEQQIWHYELDWRVDGPWQTEVFAVIDHLNARIKELTVQYRKESNDDALKFYQEEK